MDPVTASPGTRLRTVVVRIHATGLFAITLTALTVSTVGWSTGTGPYSVLADQGWGYIGLYQAYLLMFILATTCWIGSVQWPGLRMWNAVLLAAELVPFSVIFLAADVFVATDQQDKANLGIAIHAVFTTLELVALLWRLQSARLRWAAPGTP